MYSKYYECVIMQVCWFQPENAPKAFGGVAPSEGAYSAPAEPHSCIKV